MIVLQFLFSGNAPVILLFLVYSMNHLPMPEGSFQQLSQTYRPPSLLRTWRPPVFPQTPQGLLLVTQLMEVFVVPEELPVLLEEVPVLEPAPVFPEDVLEPERAGTNGLFVGLYCATLVGYLVMTTALL